MFDRFIGKKINYNIIKYEEKFNDNLALCILENMKIHSVEDKGYFFRIFIAWDNGQVQDRGDFEKHNLSINFTIFDVLDEITV